MIYYVYFFGRFYFLTLLYMIHEIKVNHVNKSYVDGSIIPRMEEVMSLQLGYKVWIEEILLAPRNEDENIWRTACVKMFAYRARMRKKTMKIEENLSTNPLAICEKK